MADRKENAEYPSSSYVKSANGWEKGESKIQNIVRMFFFFYSGTVMMIFAHFSHSHVTNESPWRRATFTPKKPASEHVTSHLYTKHKFKSESERKGINKFRRWWKFSLPHATVNGTTTMSTRANNNFLGNVPPTRWIYATATEETPMTHNKQPQRGGETEEMWMRK